MKRKQMNDTRKVTKIQNYIQDNLNSLKSTAIRRKKKIKPNNHISEN